MDLQELINKGVKDIRPKLIYFRGLQLKLSLSLNKRDKELERALSDYHNWHEQVILILKEHHKSRLVDFDSLNHNLEQNDFDTLKFDEIICFLRSLIVAHKKETLYQKNIKPQVYIIHGFESVNRAREIKTLLTQLGLYTITLEDVAQDNHHHDFHEAFEFCTNVDYAIALYSNDSLGPNSEPNVSKSLIFEHGYMIAKLGRKRVTALVEKSVMLPFDVIGTLYIQLDKDGIWKYSLAKELMSAGMKIDMKAL